MSVIDNAKKAVDDVVVGLLGQIRGVNDSTQDAANRFKDGKTGAKGNEQGPADLTAQGDQLKIGEPKTTHNQDGSTTVETKDKDGNSTYTTTHKDGSVDKTVTNKDKDGNFVSDTKHGDGTNAQTVSAPKDKNGNTKDTTTEPDGSKTTNTTKPDGTQETKHEPSAETRGNDGPGRAVSDEPHTNTDGDEGNGPS